MNRLYTYWDNRSTREQHLILTAGVFSLCIVLYFVFWQPLSQKLAQRQQQISQQLKTLHWLQQQHASLGQLQINLDHDMINETSLETILSKTARQHAVYLTRIHKQNNAVTLNIDPVEFNLLLNWMQVLDQHYGVKVQAMTLARIPEQVGMVMVKKLQIERSE